MEEQVKEKTSYKIYADLDFNKKERKKAVLMGVLLAIFLGGLGITMLITSITTRDFLSSFMGILSLIIVAVMIGSIPASFKQYPITDKPVIEIDGKNLTVNGKTLKIQDVSSVKLTITVAPLQTKAENEKFLEELSVKRPEDGITGNIDFELKNPIDKSKVLYTTVANSFEALVALYMAGIKHYSIVYVMKKEVKECKFDLGNVELDNGDKLSSLSKKDRLKQLY